MFSFISNFLAELLAGIIPKSIKSILFYAIVIGVLYFIYIDPKMGKEVWGYIKSFFGFMGND